MADNAKNKTLPAASSENKVDKTPKDAAESAQKTPAYSKHNILQHGGFNLLDKGILTILLKDGEKITVDQAKKLIKEYKGAK